MTDEISIRAGRERRGKDFNGTLVGNDDTAAPNSNGETAWDLSDAPPGPATKPVVHDANEEAPAFPAFPGLGDSEEEEKSGPGLDIMRFVRGILKRLWLIILITAAFSALSVWFAKTQIEDKWEAVTVLVHRPHQDIFGLGSSTPFKPQEYNLKTLLDTVLLPSSLDAVMKANDISVLRRTLAAAMEIKQGKHSNIFQVKATWDDPQTAVGISTKAAQLLIERSRMMLRQDAETAYKYYGAMLIEAQEAKRAINEELRRLYAETGTSNFDTQIDVLISELSQLETRYNTTLAEITAMHQAQEKLSGLIKEEPEMMILSTIYRSPLQQRLTDYEWQLQEALSRYTPENPKVVKLEQRISTLKRMIKESKDEGAPQHTYAPNTQLTDMQNRYRQTEDEIKVKQAQAKALEQTIQEMREKLSRLSSSKKEQEVINSRLEGAETLESNLMNRVDEARVLMLRNESIFDLVEKARSPQEPLPSGRKLVAVAGFVLGGGFGLFIALLLEILDPRVRTRRDATDITGAEVVLEFQKTPTKISPLIHANRPSEPIAMLFRRMINEIQSQIDDEDWRCLGITSAEPRSGRTLVATNLAQALVLKEQPVILVDADLRDSAGERPAGLLGISADQPGLMESIQSGSQATELITATPSVGFDLVECGKLPPAGDLDKAPVILGHSRFAGVVEELLRPGRNLLFDLPPLINDEIALEAAATVGSLLLVVRSGQTRRSELRDTAQTLSERGIPIRAVILTDIPKKLLRGKPPFSRR